MDAHALAALFERPETGWTFAKTMPNNPHHYTLRRNWQNDDLFDEAVVSLRELGRGEKFGRTVYTQFYANGYHYWTMGAPVPETILINRKSVEQEGRAAWYDQLADAYDDTFHASDYVMEDKVVRDMLAPLVAAAPTIIDLGCGTGLFLELFPHATSGYIGFDISTAMVKRARANHPGRRFVVADAADVWVDDPDALVVSLYGSPSYIARPAFARWKGHRRFLMFYAAGYRPVTASWPGWDDVPHWPAPEQAAIDLFGKYAVLTP